MPPKKETTNETDTPLQDDAEPRKFQEYLKVLLTGTEITRHRTYRRPKKYELKLSEDRMKVTWINIKKKGKKRAIMRDTMFLVDIKSISKGQHSPAFKKYPDKERRSISLTVDYEQADGEALQLDVVFNDEETFIAWFVTLRYLVAQARKVYEVNPLALSIQKLWVNGDKQGDGLLSASEVATLLEKGMNIDLKKDVFLEKFSRADCNCDDNLDANEFEKLIWDIKQNDVVDELWSRYTKGRNIMTLEKLEAFINAEQDEEPTSDEVADSIERLTGKRGHLTKSQFLTYLTQSSLNDAVHDEAERPGYQNMSYNLTEYYIKASANSNDVPKGQPGNCCSHIALLLQRGVRFLHLPITIIDDDICVGSDRSTAHSCAKLSDVLNAVKENSFNLPHLCYPIIILFETYIPVDQQKFATQTIKDILGFAIETDEKRTTPDELKGRYLLAACASPTSRYALSSDWGEITYFEYKTYQPGFDRNRHPEIKKMVLMSMGQGALERSCSDPAKYDRVVGYHGSYLALLLPKTNETNCNVAQAWSCGVQLGGANFHIKDDDYIAPLLSAGRFSQNGSCGYVLKPTSIRNPGAVSKKPQKVEVKEANADELMAALRGENVNSADKRKKAEDVLDPTFGHGRDNRAQTKLIITVISGQQIPRPEGGQNDSDIPDPFVEVRVDNACGAEDKDELVPFSQVHTTQEVDNNAFCPMYRQEFSFSIKTKETAILSFRIYDKDLFSNDFLCQRSVPVSCLLPGYRCLFLRNRMGAPMASVPSIFLHIEESRVGTVDHLQKEKAAMQNDIMSLRAEIEEIENRMSHNKLKLKRLNENIKRDTGKLKDTQEKVRVFTEPWFYFNFNFFLGLCRSTKQVEDE
eukprot:PhM_4_TR4406/c0_g1_i1/m.88918/K05857/PLCD; phosphatidylinositol phospholipase C, delta